MKIGIVLKDRCHEDALKCEYLRDKSYLARALCSTDSFFVTEKHIVAKSEIKYVYIIND